MRAVQSADVLMVRLRHRIDAPLLAGAGNLRAIVSATTGLNHIDLDVCRSKNVEVISLRGEREFLESVTSTAELALGLLLALARRIVRAHADVLAGRWRRDEFFGSSLRGLTLGLVGLGRLGSVMAGYGQALGMRLIGTDQVASAIPPFVHHVTLDALLAEADCVSLHASHIQGTPPVLRARELAIMKTGAILINTARGELVDEAALLAALESGRVGGYGADVLADETRWSDCAEHPLVEYARTHSNVLLTPHLGGATRDGLERTEAFVVGKTLRHFGLATPMETP